MTILDTWSSLFLLLSSSYSYPSLLLHPTSSSPRPLTTHPAFPSTSFPSHPTSHPLASTPLPPSFYYSPLPSFTFPTPSPILPFASTSFLHPLYPVLGPYQSLVCVTFSAITQYVFFILQYFECWPKSFSRLIFIYDKHTSLPFIMVRDTLFPDSQMSIREVLIKNYEPKKSLARSVGQRRRRRCSDDAIQRRFVPEPKFK